MEKLSYSGTHLSVISAFNSQITDIVTWHQGVISQLLETGKLRLTTSEYLYQYEQWKKTKPFGMKKTGDGLGNIFKKHENSSYSGVVSKLIQSGEIK